MATGQWSSPNRITVQGDCQLFFFGKNDLTSHGFTYFFSVPFSINYFVTAHERSCGKLMFSVACVCLFTGEGSSCDRCRPFVKDSEALVKQE